MSDDRMANGIIKIEPPLNWGEIRQFQEWVNKSRSYFVMALSLTSRVENDDRGEYKIVTSNMAECYEEGARGVEEFLMELGKMFAKTHELTGEVIVIEPQCEQDFNTGPNRDATRYTFEGGKLMRQYPVISWGIAEEFKYGK